MSAAVGLFAFGIGTLGGGALARWSQLGASCLVGGIAAAALHRRSAHLTRLASGGACGVAASLLFLSSPKIWDSFLLREPSQLLFASYEAVSIVGFGVGVSSELYSLASGIEKSEASAELLCDRVVALFRALCGQGSLRFTLVEIGGSIFVPGGEWIFEPAWREGVESDQLLRGVNLWLGRQKELEFERLVNLVASTSNLSFESLEEREKGAIRSFIEREIDELKLPELKGDESEALKSHELFTKRFLIVERLLKQTLTNSEKFELLKAEFRGEKYQSLIGALQKRYDPEQFIHGTLRLNTSYYRRLKTHLGLISENDVAGHLVKLGFGSEKLKDIPKKKEEEERYNALIALLNPPIPPLERVRRGIASLFYQTVALSSAAASLVTAPLLYVAGAALGILTNHLPSFAPDEERSTASIGDAFRASPPFILAGSGLASLHLGRGTLRERADRFSRLSSLLQMRLLSAELCQDCLAVQCGRWGAFARGWLAGGELRRQISK